MRVAHVYSGNLYGGVEALLATIARYQQSQPSVVHEFALCFQGRLSQELAQTKAAVHFLGPVSARRPWTVWRARRRLRLLLRSRFDVAVFHSAWPLALFGACGRGAGLPVIFWLHDIFTGRRWEERLAKLVRPDVAICNSQFTRSTLKRVYPDLKSEVLHCPVPTACSRAERTITRTELGVYGDEVVIIQVSRMESCKGHPLHLRALGRLRHLPGWICWMVGGAQRPHERKYAAGLRELAVELGISERVKFLGERPDVARLLSAADIYCQPNTGPESFGITFIEALGAGLPVVTSAIGGATEIVTDSCGCLVPANDSNALADTLVRLVDDNNLRIRLGAAGVARARSLCDVETQLVRIADILRASAGHVCG